MMTSITRRNWLLRCSIIVNVVVILYIAILQDSSGDQKQTGRILTKYLYQSANGENLESSKPLAEPLKDIKNYNINCPTQSVNEISNTEYINVQNSVLINNTNTVSEVRLTNAKSTVVQTSSLGPKTSQIPVIPNSNLQDPNSVSDLSSRLKIQLKCHDRDFISRVEQRGDFWVLKNYIKAQHGPIACADSVTYTTHADYTFLDNVIPLLERWQGPLSIALHAPGNDFLPTLSTIRYLRDCAVGAELVRQYTTFHVYFSSKHIPKTLPKGDAALSDAFIFNCSMPPPYVNINNSQLYKTQKKLLYPVNVGRNIAREAALTHFILASDIELYPSPDLIPKFLEMISRNEGTLLRKNARVFPLSIFEVTAGVEIPRDKTTLIAMLKAGTAIPFHKRLCSSCHKVPKAEEWVKYNETEDLGVFHVGKRIGHFIQWEPIYIGTHADPLYDERLSWEGKKDKMTQGYALCVMDYDFQILDNAFLVHKPGIKELKKDPKRQVLSTKTNQLIKRIIYPELKLLYGTRKGCAV